MKNITFLGPAGATFSSDAYDILADIYNAPKASQTNCVLATVNGEILKLIAQHGGYGAMAMETLIEGRVNEPLESFIELLKSYKSSEECPFHVVGAIHKKISFCLMTRPTLSVAEITKVIAHPKALGACKGGIAKMKLPTVNAPSNGEAARLVALNDEYATYAVLGPKSAAEKFNLKIINSAFEDQGAITTFVLLAPNEHKISVGKENRVIIVFKIPHVPGALVKSLLPFDEHGLNLLQIHSIYAGNHTYNFAIEFKVEESELTAFDRAMEAFKKHVETYLSFGPFEVLSK